MYTPFVDPFPATADNDMVVKAIAAYTSQIAAALAGGGGSGVLNGDVTGPFGSNTVKKILGNSVPTNASGYLNNDGSGNLTWGSVTPFNGGTISNPLIETANGAASTPAMLLNGSIFTGGSGSTNWPQFLVQPTGTTSSIWSTSGTLIGANAPSGYGGNLIDLQVNGVKAFSVDTNGAVNIGQPGFGTVTLFGASGNLAVGGSLSMSNGNLNVGTPDSGSINVSCGSSGVGTTSTDKLSIFNNIAAAAGAQQWSGRIRWTGQGWKTASTAGSQEVDYIAELQTVQGTNNPTGLLAFSAQVNNAGYAKTFAIDTAGGIQTGQGVLSAAGVWKLGALRTSTALLPSTTQVLQVDVGGTLYSLLLCSTNP